MNWQSKMTESGPVWTGEDSIYDVFHENRRMNRWADCGVYAIGLPGIALTAVGASYCAFMAAFSWHNDWTAVAFCAFFACFFWLLLGISIIDLRDISFVKSDRFIVRAWSLAAGDDGFVYRAGLFDAPLRADQVSRDGRAWSVDLNAVVRVESGLTANWQPARHYEGGPAYPKGLHPVPKHEYQTFLFLADGSRRVIQTANADREGTATLAQSIRAWLESRREQREAAPVVMEGFDI